MALTEYTLETFTVGAGTLTVKLLHPDAGLVVPSEGTIEDIGRFSEKIEVEANQIELASVDMTVLDVVNATYTAGFWFALLNAKSSASTELPEIMFLLDQGSGDTHLFTGRIDYASIRVNEDSTSTTKPRRFSFTLISNLRRMEDVTWSDFIDDLDVRMTADEQLASRPVVSLALTGTDNGVTYGYKVAARDANGEYLPGPEDTISGPTNLGASFITISWGAVTGAVDYTVYRTIGGPSQGAIYTTNALTYNDTGTAAAIASRYSARQFVKWTDAMRSLVYLAFGGSYVTGRVVLDNYDLKVDDESDGVYMLYQYNSGTGPSPVLSHTVYFDSGADEFLGNRYATPFHWLISLCKSFCAVPRVVYESSAYNLHLVTRGRGASITPSGELSESVYRMGNTTIPKHIKVSRQMNTDDYFARFENSKGEYNVDMAVDFLVQTSPATAVNDYEKLYVGDSNALGLAFSAAVKVAYYDYELASWVEYTSGFCTQACIALYLYKRYNGGSKEYSRAYESLTASDGVTTSHLNVKPGNTISINDGGGSATYYITDVSKDVVNDSMSVTLIEQ